LKTVVIVIVTVITQQKSEAHKKQTVIDAQHEPCMPPMAEPCA